MTTSGGGKFVAVPDCTGEERAASVVSGAAEAFVLEPVAASSSTCRLEFLVRAPHTCLSSGDLVQDGEAYGSASVL